MATNTSGTTASTWKSSSNLCDHYKPVGIQAVSAAVICRAPQPTVKPATTR
ncbi:hypothetical protein [Amorphus orientalis]|uniref:Uncharacterized protein n=1 Tax=Amorphus orientalis TaxID=649198 RepID=A0AAE4AUF5_9HYPH|nr:hypothetical protein [Amorphus orientalis]MDQ0317340.1 hypothetical protein [Amorphus orientalis]